MTEYQLMRLCASEYAKKDRDSQSYGLQDMDPSMLSRPMPNISGLRFFFNPHDFRALARVLSGQKRILVGVGPGPTVRYRTPHGDPVLDAHIDVPSGKVWVVEERDIPKEEAR